MKKIDFTKLKTPVGVKGLEEKNFKVMNIAKSLADMIYNNLSGIAPKRLAEKIYDSEGPIELSDEDVRILNIFISSSEDLLLPIKDGIEFALKEQEQREIKKETKPIKK